MKRDKCRTIVDIINSIISYINDNNSYESNDILASVINKIKNSRSIEDVFRIPIADRVFSFNAALNWLYFVCFVIHTVKEEHITLPNVFNISFSTSDALIYISNTYNAVNENLMHDYFDASDSDSD